MFKNRRGIKVDGQKFGRLTVLETFWDTTPIKVKCICDCGAIGIYAKQDVYSGHTKSCGCLQSERSSIVNTVDHSDEVSDYGIRIINRSHKNDKGQWLWNCKCGYCDNIFQELPARILNNHVKSCGCIKHSSREKYIDNYLKSIGIDYKREITFNDLRMANGYPLRFDFAIFKNNSLDTLIEYYGEQHFYPVSVFGGEAGFQQTKIRDDMKDKYCHDHNIRLIRIPFTKTEAEIKEIINNIK